MLLCRPGKQAQPMHANIPIGGGVENIWLFVLQGVVDDHEVVEGGLADLLARVGGDVLEVERVVPDALEALRLALEREDEHVVALALELVHDRRESSVPAAATHTEQASKSVRRVSSNHWSRYLSTQGGSGDTDNTARAARQHTPHARQLRLRAGIAKARYSGEGH